MLVGRSFSSGPWHLKQLLERMGRISRLKSTGFSSVLPAPAETTQAINQPQPTANVLMESERFMTGSSQRRLKTWRDAIRREGIWRSSLNNKAGGMSNGFHAAYGEKLLPADLRLPATGCGEMPPFPNPRRPRDATGPLKTLQQLGSAAGGCSNWSPGIARHTQIHRHPIERFGNLADAARPPTPPILTLRFAGCALRRHFGPECSAAKF
jgi:hypothetical protein